MKSKILITVLLIFSAKFVHAQSGWTKKINFAGTARIAGRVSLTAKKISKSAPGLAGAAVWIIGSAAQAISTSAKKAGETKVQKDN